MSGIDWLSGVAPYCGETLRDTDCPEHPGRWHMCVAKPDHERGRTEHHVCDCGEAWTSLP